MRFRAILTLHLCNSAFGAMNTWDGERFHDVASRGLSGELLEALEWGKPFTGQPGGVADRLLRGEDVIVTRDIAEDADVQQSSFAQTMMRVGGAPATSRSHSAERGDCAAA